ARHDTFLGNRLVAEPLPNLLHAFALPVSLVIVQRHEAASTHAIHVNSSVQVIDLMLQDPGIPAGCTDAFRFRAFIEAFDCYLSRAWHQRCETVETQASFKELDRWFAGKGYPRIDDYVKWNCRPLPHSQVACREFGPILRRIFDNCKLDWKTDRRSRQSDTWRVSQGLAH